MAEPDYSIGELSRICTRIESSLGDIRLQVVDIDTQVRRLQLLSAQKNQKLADTRDKVGTLVDRVTAIEQELIDDKLRAAKRDDLFAGFNSKKAGAVVAFLFGLFEMAHMVIGKLRAH